MKILFSLCIVFIMNSQGYRYVDQLSPLNTEDILSNVQRVLYVDSKAYILSNNDKINLVKLGADGTGKPIAFYGKGPNEIFDATDMCKGNNSLYILGQSGRLYRVVSDELELYDELRLSETHQRFNSISSLDEHRFVITTQYSENKENIKNLYGIYDIREKKLNWLPVNIGDFSYSKERDYIFLARAFAFYAGHQKLFLTMNGSNELIIYNLATNAIEERISYQIANYQGVQDVMNKTYGKGHRTDRVFSEKGIDLGANVLYCFGNQAAIEHQYLIVSKTDARLIDKGTLPAFKDLFESTVFGYDLNRNSKKLTVIPKEWYPYANGQKWGYIETNIKFQ